MSHHNMQPDTTKWPIADQIGQLLMVGFAGKTPTPEIIDLIENGRVGGIVFFSRNIGTARDVLDLTSRLQTIARDSGHQVPLLIAIDQENGVVQRLQGGITTFPGNMAQGAIDDAETTRAIAAATGKELAALGITMNLAPDIDINNNPANPVIGVRSFGEDPESVARLGAAAVAGYQSVGVVSSVKHFPGHGDTATDSHLGLPVVPFDRARLDAVELVPFRACIAADAATVMIAHVALPALTGDATLPATLSRVIIHDLLRVELGFNNVIISDCVEMSAVADGVGSAQGALMTLQAGSDIALVSHTYARQKDSVQLIHAAVADGLYPQEDLRAACARVVALKARFMSWETLPDPHNQPRVHVLAHQSLSKASYARAVTLVRDDAHIIPIYRQPDKRVLVIAPALGHVTMAVDLAFDPQIFVDVLRENLLHVDLLTLPLHPTTEDIATLTTAAHEATITILLTVNADRDPRQASLMQALIDMGHPLIGIAAYNPYDIHAFPQLGTYLATYEYTAGALRAAANVIMGSKVAVGKLPVAL